MIVVGLAPRLGATAGGGVPWVLGTLPGGLSPSLLGERETTLARLRLGVLGVSTEDATTLAIDLEVDGS